MCVIDVYSITIYDVRLTDGYEGTVEVLTYHGWLPMCSVIATDPEYEYDTHSIFTWDSHTESKVLCRQLGYDINVASTPCNTIDKYIYTV